MLRFAPAVRPEEADFVLDIRVADYGLVADSFEGATFFVLTGQARLLAASTGEVLWDADLAERETVTRTTFGLPAAVGNVVTGRALAGLSVDQMATGLGRLADLAARADHRAAGARLPPLAVNGTGYDVQGTWKPRGRQ